MSERGRIRGFENVDALTAGAAEEFVARANQSVAAHGRFAAALSGGNTPKFLYRHLASSVLRERVPWEQVHLFWGDERTVPSDHADSNFGLAQRELLSHIAVPPENVHRIRTELGARGAAEAYERELQSFFATADAGPACFDLIFLGMGEDGHTASLFPDTDAVAERRRLVTSTWVPNLETTRITFTLRVLNEARCVLFLIAGESKATMLARVLQAPPTTAYPASLIQPEGELLWFIDQTAGRLLERSTT